MKHIPRLTEYSLYHSKKLSVTLHDHAKFLWKMGDRYYF